MKLVRVLETDRCRSLNHGLPECERSIFAPRRPSYLRVLLLSGVFALLFFPAPSQFLPRADAVPAADEIEDLVGDEVQIAEAAFITDRLERLRGKPLDINTATVEELTELPWISPLLARKIVALREKVRTFRSLFELSVIEGVTYELLKSISPYVTVAYKGVPFWEPLEGRVRIVSEDVLGGNSANEIEDVGFYARVTSRPSEQLELCFLVDKDRGESSIGDFQAGYATVRRKTLLSALSLGDLSAEFGHGLVLWAPGGFFSGYETVSQAARSSSGVKGYRSSTENGALRGVHAQLKGSKLSTDVLFSRSKLDAYLNDDGTVRRLADSGYHRDDWELRGKDALSEELFALHLAGRFGQTGSASRSLVLEGTYCASSYDPVFSAVESSPSYYFTGRRTSVAGLGARLSLPQISMFGEAGFMDTGSMAALLGWVLDVRQFTIATVLRSYGSDYYNLRASSFSGGNPWNERGLYVGVQTALRNSKLSIYVDGVHHPGPDSDDDFPTSGYEGAASLERNVARGIKTRLRAKISRREFSAVDPTDPYERITSVSRRETVYGDVFWTPPGPLSMKFRVSTVRANDDAKGTLSFVGFAYAPEGVVNVKGRVVYYDTSSYESRIYEYEDELPGRVSLDPLWGEGVKWYLLVGARSRRLTLSTKFSQNTVVDERSSSELGLQVDFAF